jgi:uncharacterized membrane protein
MWEQRLQDVIIVNLNFTMGSLKQLSQAEVAVTQTVRKRGSQGHVIGTGGHSYQTTMCLNEIMY